MTNNNPEEVENLIKNGYVSDSPNPDDYVVVTALGKAKGKRSKSNRYPNTKYAVPLSKVGKETVVAPGFGTSVSQSTGPNGETIYTVSTAGSSAINYSNVLFVDPVFGNDGTGLPGRFDLPYLTVRQAAITAGNLPSSATSRILVYVRKGLYQSNILLKNNVDFYCEPGVVFQFYGATDQGVSVNSNVLGYAKFQDGFSPSLWITGGSNVRFQFDSIRQTYSNAVYCQPPTGIEANVVIEGRSIYCGTIGVGYAVAFRGITNATMNISEYIKAPHSVIDIRLNYAAKLVINTPKIILENTNYYGGNFKHAFICYSSTADARMTINADLINEGTSYLGGISGMVANWSSTSGIVEVNGNIYAGETVGLYCSGNQVAGRMVVNGSIFSNIQPVYVASENSCYVKNGVVSKPSTFAANTVRTIQNAKLFMSNVQLYNAAPDIHLIKLDSTTSQLYLYDVVGEATGATALSIDAVAPVNIQAHGSRFNKDKGVNVTDALTPSGFIFDPVLVVPKF